MKTIIVLGSGCTKCVKTAEIIEKIAEELGAEVSVSKETSPEAIMSYGVMSTPAVVVDGAVLHTGSIPQREQIQLWLET
jgi:small redox-active disulfide protein 2